MLKIDTLIKKGEEFIPIEQWIGKFKNPDYIEGALKITLNDKVILDEKLWDDVNYLWPYLINGLPDIASGKDFETGFPDQPIVICIKNISKIFIEIKIFSSDEVFLQKTIQKNDFLSEMVRAARFFLTRCQEISPGCEPSFEYYINILNGIELGGQAD